MEAIAAAAPSWKASTMATSVSITPSCMVVHMQDEGEQWVNGMSSESNRFREVGKADALLENRRIK